MNILQINSVCGTGSTGRIASDLHAVLVSQGHRSTVAFGRGTALNCGQTIRIGNRIDTCLHVARTRLFDTHGFGSAGATRAFIAKMDRLSPDVIYLHNLHGYYLHIGLMFEYLKQTGTPIIWTLFDCWAFTGHCAYCDYLGCPRWKTGCHDCPLKASYPKSLLRDRSQWNWRQKREIFSGVPQLTIVTSSNWLAALVGQSFLRDYPTAVINSGIDLTVFRPTPGDFRRRYGLKDHFVLLGVADGWDDRKGYPCFMELARHLRSDEKIVLVGVNAQQLKRLPAGIIGIAKTNNTKELAEIYTTVDLFLNPTLEDNFPTTNLEALACGTPVVTFNTGGSTECLAEGCGLVVGRGDMPGLLAAIATVRQRGKGAYAARCRQRAQDRFDKDARFADYLRLYRG